VLRRAQASTAQTLALANAQALNADVEWAEPNFLNEVALLANPPSDPLFGEQWHLNNTGQFEGVAGADVSILEAWDLSRGDGINIAVLDDGTEVNHPDLRPNIFINPGEIPGNSRDDDNNGYIDDVNGWDYGNAWSFFGYVFPEPDDNDPSPPDDDSNHGTAVAGVAAATTDNSLGVSGAAPASKILPIRLFLYGRPGVFLTAEKYASAIYYAAGTGSSADGTGRWRGADVFNMSFGIANPDFSDTGMAAVHTALTWAATEGRSGKGCVLLAAAGNEDAEEVLFPASHPNVIAVGASTDRDVRAAYSNRGSKLDFVAPSGPWSSRGQAGQRIRTTDRTDAKGYNTSPSPGGDYTPDFGGTSSASPLAAGVAALILSANPDLSSEEVRRILRETADKIGGVTYDAQGFHREYGYGRINADRAVHRAVELRPAAGTLTFDQSTYSISERDGSATLIVQRVAGDSGSILPGFGSDF
jgi:subtilisin family serine protease